MKIDRFAVVSVAAVLFAFAVPALSLAQELTNEGVVVSNSDVHAAQGKNISHNERAPGQGFSYKKGVYAGNSTNLQDVIDGIHKFAKRNGLTVLYEYEIVDEYPEEMKPYTGRDTHKKIFIGIYSPDLARKALEADGDWYASAPMHFEIVLDDYAGTPDYTISSTSGKPVSGMTGEERLANTLPYEGPPAICGATFTFFGITNPSASPNPELLEVVEELGKTALFFCVMTI